MKKNFGFLILFFLPCIMLGGVVSGYADAQNPDGVEGEMIRLPSPRLDGPVSLERTLLNRRSVRAYEDEPLSLDQISQLLWAAQGITSPNGFRTAPSAGARYPLEIYLVAGDVEGISSGIYHYLPRDHALKKIGSEDKRVQLSAASRGQEWVEKAPGSVVFSAVYERVSSRYGQQRGVRYTDIEVGHSSQNFALEAVALGLGTVVVGAFDDQEVKKIIGLPEVEEPILILPVGKTK